MRLLTGVAAAAAAIIVGLAAGAHAEERFITVASTTSTQASGLFEHLLPKFEDKTGIDVRVVAVGTGKAIRMAEKGDADVLFVHHKPSEEKFAAEGFGLERRDVMYNDFVLVGPKSDPAGAGSAGTAAGALRKIAEAEAPFASRGDDSGTNKAELAQWKAAGVDVQGASGHWYRETGAGMGATLNTAAGMDAYTLTDRATWLSFRNRGDLGIVFQGDPALFNQYGVIVVNPERFPHVKADDAQAFADWLVSPDGQETIAEYRTDGDQPFFPNAAGS
ncbi:substrate-binding domain-containing protein [Caenispirillum salinarum]|uniref:substrate-binding domain-containing protein n=1 Tax=Caenispirillum salinarum TaxID=859058 RepID=UPI00384D4E3B